MTTERDSSTPPENPQEVPPLSTALGMDHFLTQVRKKYHGGQPAESITLTTGGAAGHIAGKSLLDYFAGQALAGLTANPHVWEELHKHEIAEHAFLIARLMIAERSRREGSS